MTPLETLDNYVKSLPSIGSLTIKVMASSNGVHACAIDTSTGLVVFETAPLQRDHTFKAQGSVTEALRVLADMMEDNPYETIQDKKSLAIENSW